MISCIWESELMNTGDRISFTQRRSGSKALLEYLLRLIINKILYLPDVACDAVMQWMQHRPQYFSTGEMEI